MRPAGIPPGCFILTPDSVYYCQIQLLFSFSAMTDTGSKSFDCALVSVLEPYEGAFAGGYLNYLQYLNFLFVLQWGSLHLDYLNHCLLIGLFGFFVGRLAGNRRISDAYEPDPRKQPGEHQNYQWVVPVDSIIGKLPVVPIGDTGTIPYSMAARFPGAHGDSRPDADEGCLL